MRALFRGLSFLPKRKFGAFPELASLLSTPIDSPDFYKLTKKIVSSPNEFSLEDFMNFINAQICNFQKPPGFNKYILQNIEPFIENKNLSMNCFARVVNVFDQDLPKEDLFSLINHVLKYKDEITPESISHLILGFSKFKYSTPLFHDELNETLKKYVTLYINFTNIDQLFRIASALSILKDKNLALWTTIESRLLGTWETLTIEEICNFANAFSIVETGSEVFWETLSETLINFAHIMDPKQVLILTSSFSNCGKGNEDLWRKVEPIIESSIPEMDVDQMISVVISYVNSETGSEKLWEAVNDHIESNIDKIDVEQAANLIIAVANSGKIFIGINNWTSLIEILKKNDSQLTENIRATLYEVLKKNDMISEEVESLFEAGKLSEDYRFFDAESLERFVRFQEKTGQDKKDKK